MSVGDTDRYYWEELYNWLNEDQKRQLIFYLYDGAFSPYNPNHRPRICGEYRELFREMTWKIDEKMKRCTVNNQNIYFLKGQCPKHNCGKTKCSSEELKDSCKNFLKGSVTKKCQEKNCPYNKVRSGTDPHNCTSWHEIRRRIHFAIQKNIFAMDLVKRNYYPAMMYDFILRGILREDEKGAWFLEDRKIAVMDPITVNNVRAAAAARAGFKLYYLYTQLQKKVTPADFEEVLKKTGTPLDPSADAYKKYISWLTQEEETLKEKGAELKTPKITEQNQEQYWDATEQFVKVLKNGDHIYKEEEARKIADFYTGIRNWRKLS